MRARYYDATVGRFISEDPSGFEGGDVNLYAYCGDNPINRVDPSGLEGRSVSAQYWPRWIEPFVPGYGNYGGPMRTDPSFSTKPVDSMDRLFMQHDIGWARGQGRQADKTVIEGLYSLPSNPRDWTE